MSFFHIQDLQYLDSGPVNLDVNESEIIGLHGASGTGKSRLLRALADLDEHQGKVSLKELEQTAVCAHVWRKKVALLSAETQWWLDSVGEHFQEIPQQSARLLGFEENIANWQVSRLSSGEKQRLGLLRLMQNKPQVLLLDEPTANLDHDNTLIFEKFVMQYVQENAACSIWVSHDMEQLDRISQRQYEIKSGGLFREQVKS